MSLKATVLGGLAFLMGGCEVYDALQQGKQVRTYTDLQTISSRAELFREDHGRLRHSDLLSIIAEYRETDVWGRPWLVISAPIGDDQITYAIASAGRDGKFEYRREEYLSIEPKMVAGCLDCDIVFRDGVAVRNAGK